jgi:hypothetical protein
VNIWELGIKTIYNSSAGNENNGNNPIEKGAL